MKKNLIILLLFLPLTFFSQDLKCCKSEKEVETYLKGSWIVQDGTLKYLYQYMFNNGKGLLRIFEIKENDSLEKIKGGELSVKIIKTENGFGIETYLKFGGILSKIEYLDFKRIVLIEDNGEKTEFNKVLE